MIKDSKIKPQAAAMRLAQRQVRCVVAGGSREDGEVLQRRERGASRYADAYEDGQIDIRQLEEVAK